VELRLLPYLGQAILMPAELDASSCKNLKIKGRTGMPRNRLAGGGLQVVAGRFPDLTAGESRCLPNLRSYLRRNGEREARVLLNLPQLFPGLHYAGVKTPQATN